MYLSYTKHHYAKSFNDFIGEVESVGKGYTRLKDAKCLTGGSGVWAR
jgi:hypothetical protein